MQALEGIKIVDVGGSVATAYCAKNFADYGAEVINLEPAEGFATRRLAPYLDPGPATSALHAYLSTKKKSVRVDQLSPQALTNILRADLVLDCGDGDLVPADSHRLTIEWFGDGSYADYTGTDAQMFATNGMLRNIGPAQGPPLIPTGHQAQIIGGVTAFVAGMGCLLGSELGNNKAPMHVRTSILEAMLCFTDVGIVNFHNTGLSAPRMGTNRFPPTYPLGVFPCRDGWLGVTVLTPGQWRSFCKLLALDALADVPLFQTSVGRLESMDIIEPLMCERLLQHSAEDLFYRAQAARIPLARVPTMEELFQVDQYLERQAFCTARVGDTALTIPGTPFRLHATPGLLGGRRRPPWCAYQRVPTCLSEASKGSPSLTSVWVGPDRWLVVMRRI